MEENMNQFAYFNYHEQVTSLRFAPQEAQEDYTLMATANIMGHVKLYKLRQNEV